VGNPAASTGILCNALWDTGAMHCCISDRAVLALGLQMEDTGAIRSATGLAQVGVYRVNLKLSNDILLPDIQIVTFSAPEDFDVVIGMDVITRGDLAITNAGGKTVFSFRIPPDARHIDFSAGRRG
jgi:hypothetical protein